MTVIRKSCRALILAGILFFVFTSCEPGSETREHYLARDHASRVTAPGLKNFYRVSKSLYRGAQPGPEGFPELKKRGIKTIVNLRTSNSDRGRADKYGIAGVHIPVNASSPRKEDFAVFLKIATDPARQPVFVHCRHGADRTGAAVALYRIYVQGWTKDEAIEEMTRGGYGFHALFSSLKDFIRKF